MRLVLPRSDASASGILSENEDGKRVGLPFDWHPSVCTYACWSSFFLISFNANFPSCTFEILLCVWGDGVSQVPIPNKISGVRRKWPTEKLL